MHTLIVRKDGHTFLFRWTDTTWRDVLRSVGNHAAQADCVLNWHDAAVICKYLRAKRAKHEQRIG